MKKLLVALTIVSMSCTNNPFQTNSNQNNDRKLVAIPSDINGNWKFTSSRLEMYYNSGLTVYDSLLLKNSIPFQDPNNQYNRYDTISYSNSTKFSQFLNIMNGIVIDSRIYKGENILTLNNISYARDSLTVKVKSDGKIEFDTCVNTFMSYFGHNDITAFIDQDTLLFQHVFTSETKTLCNNMIKPIKCLETVKYLRSELNENIDQWRDSCTSSTCGFEAHTATIGFLTTYYVNFLGWLCD